MNELIKVVESTVGSEVISTVNARDLHVFLEVGRDFSSWIKDRIEKYSFSQDSDFIVFTGTGENLDGRPRIDYHISLDMAKELSMVERNEKGREARKYFIACEKRLNDLSTLSPAELILRQAQRLVDQERRLAEINDRVKRIECKQQAFEEGIRYFTVIGYVGYKGLPSVNMTQAQKIGRIAKKLSVDRNVGIDRVKDQRHGYVGSYHETILDDAYAALLEEAE